MVTLHCKKLKKLKNIEKLKKLKINGISGFGSSTDPLTLVNAKIRCSGQVRANRHLEVYIGLVSGNLHKRR